MKFLNEKCNEIVMWLYSIWEYSQIAPLIQPLKEQLEEVYSQVLATAVNNAYNHSDSD